MTTARSVRTSSIAQRNMKKTTWREKGLDLFHNTVVHPVCGAIWFATEAVETLTGDSTNLPANICNEAAHELGMLADQVHEWSASLTSPEESSD